LRLPFSGIIENISDAWESTAEDLPRDPSQPAETQLIDVDPPAEGNDELKEFRRYLQHPTR
jgi:hypothetical protein